MASASTGGSIPMSQLTTPPHHPNGGLANTSTPRMGGLPPFRNASNAALGTASTPGKAQMELQQERGFELSITGSIRASAESRPYSVSRRFG